MTTKDEDIEYHSVAEHLVQQAEDRVKELARRKVELLEQRAEITAEIYAINAEIQKASRVARSLVPRGQRSKK